MCEMFEMFVSQGRSGSHLLKKPGRGFLTLVDRRVAARAAPVTFVALPVDGFCRTTAVGGFLGVSIGLAAAGTAGGLGVAGATGAAPGAAVTGPLGTTQVRTLV